VPPVIVTVTSDDSGDGAGVLRLPVLMPPRSTTGNADVGVDVDAVEHSLWPPKPRRT
jgi:hypothetical protein